MTIDVLGVHPVDGDQPCHLIEIRVTGSGVLDIGLITQSVDGQPRSNWQAPYEEMVLDEEGRSGDFADFEPIEYSGSLRVAFFFHYLDLSRPLETPLGDVALPDPSPAPERLSFMEYEAP